MLALGLMMWAAIVGWLWYEFKIAPTEPILPSPNHLPCGNCFWITKDAWVALEHFPQNLPDQLIISVYCPEHNTFAHKRWNEQHLDDKGLKKPWQTDVDNYRGLLEGD